MARAPRAAVVVTPGAESPAPAPALVSGAEPPAPAPVSEPPVVTSSVPADLFDVAFSEAVAAEAEPTPTSPASAAVPKKPAAVPAPEPEPLTPAPEPPAPAPEPPAPAEPQPQPQPPDRSPGQAPPQPPDRSPGQAPPQAYAQEPPLFNADEVTQLQTFYTEWPDVARATETMIRGIMTQTARRMYADMAASLAPYLQTIDTLADRSQLSELQGQVPDYETVSTQLTSWAARQPAYLRSAYEHVIKSGTAAEVVDLITRYKQDMQAPAAPAQGSQPVLAAPAAAAQAAPSPPAPVNPALAAAAARLAPVNTKRATVVAPPTDFDSAFAEFARAS